MMTIKLSTLARFHMEKEEESSCNMHGIEKMSNHGRLFQSNIEESPTKPRISRSRDRYTPKVLVDEIIVVRSNFASLQAFMFSIVAKHHKQEKGLRESQLGYVCVCMCVNQMEERYSILVLILHLNPSGVVVAPYSSMSSFQDHQNSNLT